jgi:hypothetical protein
VPADLSKLTMPELFANLAKTIRIYYDEDWQEALAALIELARRQPHDPGCATDFAQAGYTVNEEQCDCCRRKTLEAARGR